MSTHKKIDDICIMAVLFAILVTVFLIVGAGVGVIPVVNAQTDSGLFTANELDGDWDTSSATKITLSDKGSTIKGNGAYEYEGDLYIVYGGHYVLSGEFTNGSVIVDADKKDKIWISLAGVDIHCEDDAAIRVEQADKVFLTLAAGTENIVSSGARYDAEVTATGVDGTIYSRDDLVMNGTGALTVNAEYQHGIVCNDDLAVTGGNITINAVQDGIHVNDSVRIREAEISITAGDDGITVSNDDETASLYVESGKIEIPACYEGLEAIEITIAGGTIAIWPADDGINANGSGTDSVIRITGGDITIINPSGQDADGLDSNGSIYMEGGNVFVSVTDSGGNCALDYGSENGGECVVSGGTVIACGGSTMAEGFAQDSPQGFLMYNTAGAAGTTISLMDSAGRELLSEEIPCSFSSVVISTPELKLGDVCIIEIGNVQEQVTIDNRSASGFGAAGMFGGGRGNGRGPREETGGMEAPEGRKLPDGMEAPDGRELPEGVEPSGGQEPFGGMGGAPGGAGFPGGMEPSEGMDLPGGMEPLEGMDFPEGMEPFDRTDIPDDADVREAGGRAFSTGAGRGEGIFSMQQNRGQKGVGGEASVSRIPATALALLGISVLVLLIGLVIAVKTRH